MTEKLYQGLCVLLLAACAGLGYQWWDARTDATAAERAKETAEKNLSDEKIVTADQRTAIDKQTASIAALETAKKEAEARVALLKKKLAAYEQRASKALQEAEKVDASKLVKCEDAMPEVRKLLKGVRP